MANSSADRITNCARVLLALTKDWQAADGNAATLSDARAMLARTIYATDGDGFHVPRPVYLGRLVQHQKFGSGAGYKDIAVVEEGDGRAGLWLLQDGAGGEGLRRRVVDLCRHAGDEDFAAGERYARNGFAGRWGILMERACERAKCFDAVGADDQDGAVV